MADGEDHMYRGYGIRWMASESLVSVRSGMFSII